MTRLKVQREEARTRVDERIAEGKTLLASDIANEEELAKRRNAFYTWHEYNERLLRVLFTSEEVAEEYAASLHIMTVIGPSSLERDVGEFQEDLRSYLRRLESILARLDLYDEPPPPSSQTDMSQEQVAQALIDLLNEIRKRGFQDQKLIQEAKNLNMRLAPTYRRLYGAIPEITSSYPAHVWWPRAKEAASQALAASVAGAYGHDEGAEVSREPEVPIEPPSRKVFIVHGRDSGLKEAVRGLILRLGLEPVILHDEPNQGRTLIEKFEDASETAGFAVILMMPDDEGRLQVGEETQPGDLRPRARQNVVWEFGYFVGLIGRAHVAVLLSDSEIERPSDIEGLVYIPARSVEDMDWRLRLAREMRTTGLPVDLNDV